MASRIFNGDPGAIPDASSTGSGVRTMSLPEPGGLGLLALVLVTTAVKAAWRRPRPWRSSGGSGLGSPCRARLVVPSGRPCLPM
jgi:hypothetical protein